MSNGLTRWLSVGILCCGGLAAADEGRGGPGRFLQAKTLFQTNSGYDPRLALAVDGVIVHLHGADSASIGKAISSWRAQGWPVGRMFFADSDGANAYWTGKWDGTPHPDDVERDAKGELVKCSGVRPYMLPTEGWIRYLEEMVVQSVDAGADAILPEEPLAHVDTGYEKSFQELWPRRYGRPWQPESASLEARYLTAQLKSELYVKLEDRLARAAKARGRELGRNVDFILPVHGLYSNVASHLVAPLGTSAGISNVDGYIGQVWTGPVNWALHHYDSPDKSFFASAYLLYDYFNELARASGRKMWFLVDPVEDDPRHEWAQFEQWYRHCVAAMLLFPEVDAYEVMPWPDRIFLPGFAMASGTPAPQRFRVIVLSATQVLQEVPAGGQWLIVSGLASSENSDPRAAGRIESAEWRSPRGSANGVDVPTTGVSSELRKDADAPTHGIGVALADTVTWEKEAFPPLQAVYGLLMPLVNAGVPASACLMERAADAAYLSRFKVIVLSYEAFKPAAAQTNTILADWVRRGGSLLILGAADDLEGAQLWWRELGYASPLHHLLGQLGLGSVEDGDHQVGRGWVFRRSVSPRRFGDPTAAREEYFPLVRAALAKAGGPELLMPEYLCMQRGPFVIAYASKRPLAIPGKLVDVFDPELPLLDGAELAPGASGVYRDVSDIVTGSALGKSPPCVLHTTHRLMSERHADGTLSVVVRGPAETPAVVRLFTAGIKPASVTARDAKGNPLEVDWGQEGPTIRVRFPNDPAGATLEVRCERPQ